MDSIFPPFEPDGEAPARKQRFKLIPVRMLIPNMITLLALCMGLSAIRMALEGRFEWAVAAIVIAAVLDSLDGRVARYLKSTSRFGAELDSLADFVNFGVSPAILLYIWALVDLKSAGWIAVLVFSLCCALRLARFNVALDNPKPAWMSNYFVGIPAPAGAITLLLPVYIEFLGLLDTRGLGPIVFIYALAIGFLMVSRVPTFSGKAIGQRVPREVVLPLFMLVAILAALLLSFPWLMLSVATIAYLASIPFSVMRYRTLDRRIGSELSDEATHVAPGPGEREQTAESPPKLH